MLENRMLLGLGEGGLNSQELRVSGLGDDTRVSAFVGDERPNPESIGRIYGLVDFERHRLDGHSPFNLVHWHKVEELAVGLNLAGKTIVDIGCNQGQVTSRLLNQGPGRVVAVDTCEKAITLAKETYNDPRLEFSLNPGHNLPLDSGTVSAVFMTFTMNHMGSGLLEATLEEVARVMEDGATLVITDYSEDRLRYKYGQLFEGENVFNDFPETWMLEQFAGLEKNGERAIVPVYYRHTNTIWRTLRGCGFEYADMIQPVPSIDLLRRSSELKRYFDACMRRVTIYEATKKPDNECDEVAVDTIG